MNHTTRRIWATLGLLLAPLAAPAQAEGIIPPFKVNFVFRFDIQSTNCPRPTAPWWAYFPQGAHEMAPASGTTFPHWPAQFPPTAQPVSAPHAAPAAGPNIVYHAYPSAVQPVGYSPAVPHYWYGR